MNEDPDGPMTCFADGRQALQMMNPCLRTVLAQKRYRLKIPMRWRLALHESAQETDDIAVVRDDSDYPDIAVAFYSDMIRALDDEAHDALLEFYDCLKAVATGIKIKPGQLAYVDNRFALHARESFKPSFDQEGRSLRWVQRVFIASNLWSHRSLIRERHRVFNPKQEQVC